MRRDNPKAAILFAQAKEYGAKGQGKKAVKAYTHLVGSYPTDKRAADSRFQAARILSASGEQQDAFNAYQQFIEHHPGNPLYTQAVARQEEVAHAAAEGAIRTSFLGTKSRLDRGVIVGMLEQVRDNAPRANSAPRAQYAIGQLNESRKQPNAAVQAYEKLIDDFPRASVAPDAQFRIGEILLKKAQSGNQDKANLSQAKDAYRDLLLAYPGSSFTSQAKQRIATIGSRNLQSTYNVAEFYRKKGELDSAAYYYQEVVDGAAASQLRNQAAAQLAKLKR